MRIQGIDHVEYYVGDLAASSAWLCDAFGFRIAGRSAPGVMPAGRSAVLLRQGQIQVLLTAAESADDPVAQYVRRHGDGIAVIAFDTEDVSRRVKATLMYLAEDH